MNGGGCFVGFIDEVDFVPQFNVFGVLRPDSSETGLPQSFIKLSSTFPIDDWDSDVDTVSVLLYRIEKDNPVEKFNFENTDLESFSDSLFRHPGFFPRSGESYQLICEAPGYPTLKAETIIPSPPNIVPGSVVLASGEIRFQVIRDKNAGLYEVILLGEGYNQSERFLRSDSGNTRISVNLNLSESSPSMLLLYAYDLNLADYLSANISIKPNIYLTDFSTVENGYGCFGSLNLAYYDLNLLLAH